MDSPLNGRSDSTVTRWWMRGCLLVGAVLFASQLIEIPWRSAMRGYDNTFNYLWLRSAAVDGDWDFRNDLEQCNTLTSDYRAAALALPKPETGRVPNKYGIGWALLTLPFYLIADAVVAGGCALGVWSLERDGFNAVYQVLIHIGHAALAVLALVLAVRVVRGWVGDGALAGVLTVWAASPLLYYQTSNLSMSHGAGFFAVTLGAHGLQRAKAGSVTAWVLAGAGFGLAAVTRFQLAVFLLLPAWAVIEMWATNRRVPRSAILGLAAGGLPFALLQLWAWQVVYGRWLVFGYGAEGEGFNWLQPALGQSLFSPWHGLYYWHPLLLLATAGLIGWVWAKRGFALAVALGFGATLYLNAAWWCWWFASSFGNRAYDAALLPLMAGMAWLAGRLEGTWHRVFWAVAILAAAWNLYVLILYRTASISRSEPVTWLEMLRAAF